MKSKEKYNNRAFNEGVDGMRIMLDHGKDCCKSMVKNIREAAEKCHVLIPIISEQRGIILIYYIDRKRILSNVINGPLDFQKDEIMIIYSENYKEEIEKNPKAISISIPSFNTLNIKEKYYINKE